MALAETIIMILTTVLNYTVILLTEIIKLVFAPLNDFDVLWTLIPVYITFLIIEYLQNTDETESFSNPVINGFTSVWVGMSWIKYLIQNPVDLTIYLVMRWFLALMIVIYGLLIVIWALKENDLVHYIGRVREVTYIVVMLTPIFYGFVELTFLTLLAMILFFPIYWLTLDYLLKKLPKRA